MSRYLLFGVYVHFCAAIEQYKQDTFVYDAVLISNERKGTIELICAKLNLLKNLHIVHVLNSHELQDIDTFNELLHNEGISKWDLDDFEELCDSYDSFISKANKELGDSVDATYGIKGQAEEWGDMTGGAGQIVTPFGGDVLEKIGILKEN